MYIGRYSSLFLHEQTAHRRTMLVITCPICRRRELIGTRQITSVRNTRSGPLGRVRCNAGHPLRHDFRRDVTTVMPQ